MSQPLVNVLRGDLVDAVHRGDVAVVDSTGKLLASVGDPVGKIAYWRSAAKPFQAFPLISTGAAERWGMTPADLALIAGSHNGERIHVTRASALLERIGCDVTDLVCGPHPPLEPEAAAELMRRHEEPVALHNNCSGKHIGMLALAEHLGVSRLGYQSQGHPVQAAVSSTISDVTGLPAEAVTIGIDGCAVPCFGTSVYHLALAFARMMDPTAVAGPSRLAAQAISAAMVAHPYLVAGKGRLDTDLMHVAGGRLVAKGGASGVQCVGLSEGVALAIKIEDGSMGPPPSAGAVVALAALHQLGVLDEAQIGSLTAHARPQLRNVTGQIVGEARPMFELIRH